MLLDNKKNYIIEKYHLERIKSILDNSNNNIHSLIQLYYNEKLKIIEDPLFYTSENIIKNNILYLRSHSFTGLEGHLSPDRTYDIIYNSNSEVFLKFLSIFSGRLYRLRCKYLFKTLQQGDALSFKNTLIGYHYPSLFRCSKAIGKNKNISDLIDIITNRFLNIKIEYKESYKWINITTNNNTIGNILIGNKTFVKNLIITFIFNSYNMLVNNLDNIKKLKNLILIYSNFFSIKFFIPFNSKILLGQYLLGNYNI